MASDDTKKPDAEEVEDPSAKTVEEWRAIFAAERDAKAWLHEAAMRKNAWYPNTMLSREKYVEGLDAAGGITLGPKPDAEATSEEDASTDDDDAN